jgi:predicted SAM-dependent methyltransferase
MTAAAITIERVNSLIASLKRRQLYEPPAHGPVKVNLGAGLAIAPGWINIDMNGSTLCAALPEPALRLVYRLSNAKRWSDADEYVRKLKGNVLVHHNLVYGIPLPDASADYVYSAHFFEHLYREDAERLFRESHRILKPGGVLRINVPSLEPAVAALASGDTERGLEAFFPRSAEEDRSSLGRHRYMYDFRLLERLLREAGFSVVERRERRHGRVSDLEQLEHRSEDGLYVEATR